jgi:hypothetical protein
MTAAALSLFAFAAQAETTRDCMLEGTVDRVESGANDKVHVTFHAASKYEDGANCRMRRGEKLEFKIPSDPRLEEAPDGATVKYRYRRDDEGRDSAELISVGTST